LSILTHLARSARKKYASSIFTPENALLWLAIRRPDLYNAVVSDKNVMEWWEEQISRLARVIWG